MNFTQSCSYVPCKAKSIYYRKGHTGSRYHLERCSFLLSKFSWLILFVSLYLHLKLYKNEQTNYYREHLLQQYHRVFNSFYYYKYGILHEWSVYTEIIERVIKYQKETPKKNKSDTKSIWQVDDLELKAKLVLKLWTIFMIFICISKRN